MTRTHIAICERSQIQSSVMIIDRQTDNEKETDNVDDVNIATLTATS